jgi:cytochrome P450
LTDPSKRADPYPFYERLRSTEPLHQTPVSFWLASSYDCVSEILRDPRFSSDERNSAFYDPDLEFFNTPFAKLTHKMLVFLDEPDHKRLRDLVQKAFTRRVVEDLRGRIAALVDELLEPIVERGAGDLMPEFAYPLPVIVICELMGIPAEDRDKFMDWAHDFATRFEAQPLRSPEMEARGDAATVTLTRYFDELIEAKRSRPESDLISSLTAVEDEGDTLTHAELLSTCMLLLLAGHETTANLIGNGVYALLRHRDQWERLVSDASLVRPAVEEILRYDSPVQAIQRVALETVTMDGTTIEARSMVALLLGAANRDPTRFPEPDRLDVMRGDAPLVAFGGGIHFCLGAPLARLEAQLALGALVRRAPKLDLAGEPQWRPSFVLRGLETLPVRTS